MSSIDARIPMSIQYPQSDLLGNFQKGFNLGQDIQAAPFKQKAIEANAQNEQLTAANNKLTAIGNLLNGVKDQQSYSMAKQQLAAAGIINPQDIPDQYDPAYVDMHKNSVMNAKAQLDKQFKLQQIAESKAGGTSGILLDRLANEPDLKSALLTKTNAGKGVVMNPSTGQAEIVEGYNPAVASTEGAKKAAEQQAILGTAADIESEKGMGAAAGKTRGEQEKRALSAPNNLLLIQEAEGLLPNATSGLAQRAGRGVANMVGVSTDASKADRQLEVLSAALTAGVPRMEGPQSDKDVAMYKQAAGDIANPNIPYEDRLAALGTIKELNNKYQGAEQISTSVEPLNTKKVNAAQVGKLSLKDPRVKAALAAGYTPDEIAAHLTKGR